MSGILYVTGTPIGNLSDLSPRAAQTLENVNGLSALAAGARWHHERYGGGGYPDGLRGEDIPQEARIIAIADAYAAMTSLRTYRGGVLSREQAKGELSNGKGSQFDPFFTDIMLGILDEEKDTE